MYILSKIAYWGEMRIDKVILKYMKNKCPAIAKIKILQEELGDHKCNHIGCGKALTTTKKYKTYQK